MRIPLYTAAFVIGLCQAFASPPVHAGTPLRIQVTPSTVRAPAAVTVRVRVDASPENRSLQIIASSADFYRSSEITLDGAGTTPLSVFEFRNLPSGLYQVTGVLVGANGPRATVSTLARVEPSVGSR